MITEIRMRCASGWQRRIRIPGNIAEQPSNYDVAGLGAPDRLLQSAASLGERKKKSYRQVHKDGPSSAGDKSLASYRQRSAHETVRAGLVGGERCGYGDLQ